MLKLNLQFFAEDESWDSYLSEQVESVSVDDQPEEESEETVEEEEELTEEVSVEETETDSEDEETEESEDEEEESAQSELSDETEISLGDDKQPVTLKELKNGYLRQSDYTKKTQALSEERKEFEALQQEYEPIKEWTEYWSANPYLKEQIMSAVQEWEQTNVLPLEQVLQNSSSAKYINHLLVENKKLKEENEKINSDFTTTKFESEMTKLENELKAEYGELADAEYLESLRQQAQDEGLSYAVIKRIAKGDLAEKKLQQEQANSKKAVAKAKQKQKSKRLPPQPNPRAQKPSKTQPEDIEADSWEDFFKVATK